jgi:hypothetical protein
LAAWRAAAAAAAAWRSTRASAAAATTTSAEGAGVSGGALQRRDCGHTEGLVMRARSVFLVLLGTPAPAHTTTCMCGTPVMRGMCCIHAARRARYDQANPTPPHVQTQHTHDA